MAGGTIYLSYGLELDAAFLEVWPLTVHARAASSLHYAEGERSG